MIVEALALGLVVNPYSAAIGAIAVGIIWTRARTPRGLFWGLVVLAAAWFIGDAALRLRFAGDLARVGEAGAWPTFWLAAAVSLLGGYALPAWAGAFVGRRVTWGTGWLAAGVVALTAAGAVFAIGSSLAERL